MTDTIEAAADRKSTKAGLTGLKLAELKDVASSLGITGTAKMRKDDLVAAISASRGGGSSRGSGRASAGSAATERHCTHWQRVRRQRRVRRSGGDRVGRGRL